MTTTSEFPAATGHDHVFLGQNHERNEKRVWMVIALTTVMMVAEIVAGNWFGSMALTADGWHMSTHAGAMLISALAYLYARREARNPRFTFGTGKFGDLAGFASAIVLAVVALLIAVESAMRLVNPVEIDFNQAIIVAVIGLAVNLVSAVLLKDDHGHDHSHGHGSHAHHGHGNHDHGSHAHHGDHGAAKGGRDNNLRAAYLHVLADALTSVLAIVALLLGKWNGWSSWIRQWVLLAVWLSPAGHGAWCARRRQPCSMPCRRRKTCRRKSVKASRRKRIASPTCMSGRWGRGTMPPSWRSSRRHRKRRLSTSRNLPPYMNSRM